MTFKILVPIDLSEESSWGKPLGIAFDQVEKFGAHLTVMTVVPDIMAGLDWRYAIRGETRGSAKLDMREIVRDAERRLEQIIAERAPAGIEVATIARHGTVYEQILKVADELKVDLIIMSAHKPTVADFLIGQNTSSVVRHAKCSVNVVRE